MVKAKGPERDRVERIWDRADARDRADAAAAAEKARAPKQSKDTRRTLHHHDREKPTKERAAQGEFVRLPSEKFDTALKGEMLLMDLKARAGGAGEMYARGEGVTRRMLEAGAKLCELAELARASQLSGMPLKEAVDGGKMDDGSKLHAAALAAGRYREAMQRFAAPQYALIERRVVLGQPMSKLVNLPIVKDLVGGGQSKLRVKMATAVIKAGLDALADHWRLPT